MNTCSNAVESRHGHINSMIKRGNTGICNRFYHLIRYAIDSFVHFNDNQNNGIEKHKYMMRNKADEMIKKGKSKAEFSLLDCNCQAKKIYELS